MWHKYAFESLELEWLQMTFDKRNYVERWYRTFKEEDEEILQQLPDT
jgi:hypothetical protein